MPELEDTFEPIPEPEAEQPAEPVEEQEPQPEEEPEAEAAEAEPEPDDPKTVPLPTFLALRDKLKELESKVEARPKPEPEKLPPRPDIFEDPQGAAAWDARFIHMRDLNRSERLARREYGADFVDEAYNAAVAAGMAQQFAQSQFGWEDMAEWHKKNVEAAKAQEVASEIGDPAAYKEKLRAEIMAEVKAELAAKQIKDLPSLANETSIGGRSAPSVPSFTDLDDILK